MKKITLLLLCIIAFQLNAQVIASENFDTALNWTVAHTVGTNANAGWTQVTTGANPTCSPFQGTGMAKFASYDISGTGTNKYSLTSPAITFGTGSYNIKFNMYRDGTYATDADKIQVYYKATPTSAGTILGTVNRSISLAPTVTADGWYSYVFNIPAVASGTTGYVYLLATSYYGNNMFVDNITINQKFANDAEMTAFTIAPILGANPSVSIVGKFRNAGTSILDTADLKWQADGGTVNTQSLSGLALANGASYNFTHSVTWAATPGQHTITLWLENPNGVTDDDPTNNSMTKTVLVVNEVFPKTVVYEEGTGTWCGWCVRGHVGLKDMEHNHTDGSWIGIAVHNGDPMVLSAYDAAVSSKISGYPSGLINREAGEVDPEVTGLESAYQKELAIIPLAKVDIPTQSWDPATRTISYDVSSNFAMDMPSANYNLAGIIIESGITGTTTGYDQHNYYSSNGTDIIDWEGINWRNLGNPIPAATMVYNHVGRALLGGWAGVVGSIPTAVSYGSTYTTNFTYTLPTTQHEQNIKLVGIVIDNTTGQIVNAKEVALDLTLSTNNNAKSMFALYPNPTTGVFYINSEKNVDVTITDLLGKTIFSAKNKTNQTPINIASFEKGIYLVKISNENGTSTEKLILK